MEILISIIIPVYNVEQYIKYCIEPLLDYKENDIEIILVNDGSPDSCGKICDYYAKQNAHVKVIHKENGGLSSARNAGLKMAQGKYVMFIDSDDWVDAPAIKYLKQSVIEKDLDVGIFEWNIVDKDNVVVEGEKNSFKEDFDINSSSINLIREKLLFTSSLNSACKKIYKREIIEKYKVKFDEEMKYGEDLPFTLEFFSFVNNGIYMTCKLYNYRVNEDGLTRTNNPNKLKYIKIMNMLRFEYAERWGLNSDWHKYKICQGILERQIEDMWQALRDAKISKYNKTMYINNVITDDMVIESINTAKISNLSIKTVIKYIIIRTWLVLNYKYREAYLNKN